MTPIKLHDLKPAPGSKTAKTRVGRGEGSGRGKTAGRGTKGTKARKNVPATFEGGQILRSFPQRIVGKQDSIEVASCDAGEERLGGRGSVGAIDDTGTLDREDCL